jgi:serine/threonine protein kinase
VIKAARVSYCINPSCFQRNNSGSFDVCQACGTSLLIQERYVLLKPLRDLNGYESSEIFLVDDRGILKVLKTLKDCHHLSVFEPEDPMQMFEREARTLQKLKHLGTPSVEPDGYFTILLPPSGDRSPQKLHCLVMEYIEGKNLQQWMSNHSPISQEQALEWLKQLVEILEQVHQNNLFHRDIKPSNIMLRPNGQLVLIDFGSARPMTNTYFAKVGGGSQREITSVVSPGYTPLEQVNGKAVPQSDFYALGRTFVYLLTGKHPISLPEDAQTGTLGWHDYAPQITSGLQNLIDDLMAPFPGQRPLNTQEIQQRLNTVHLNTIHWNTAQLSPKARAKSPQVKKLIVLNIGLLILQITTWILWFQAHRLPANPIAPEPSTTPQNSP